METFHTYQEWLASDARTKTINWAVTHQQRGEEWVCEILQWENSNAKWYRPMPYKGRVEAGCYFDLWTKDPTRNSRIIQVRSV